MLHLLRVVGLGNRASQWLNNFTPLALYWSV